jgi:hypothetical protein
MMSPLSTSETGRTTVVFLEPSPPVAYPRVMLMSNGLCLKQMPYHLVDRKHRLSIYVEPWAEIYALEPNKMLRIDAAGPVGAAPTTCWK